MLVDTIGFSIFRRWAFHDETKREDRMGTKFSRASFNDAG
jgi:hypothetical protein